MWSIPIGEAAHSGCCKTAPEKIGLTRRRLAVDAGEIVGLAAEDMYWMGLSDGKIPRKDDRDFKKAVVRLSKYIEEIRPQEIFSPHYLDCWPDHEAASEIVSSALKVTDYKCDLFYYPVWMWHSLRLKFFLKILKLKNIRIDITPYLGRKKTALTRYLSALNPECGKPFCEICRMGLLIIFKITTKYFSELKITNNI